MYKVGIIGFGKMGMLHGALLCGSGQAEITAICDKSVVMRLGFKRVYKKARVYKDAEKMLNKEKLDIVVVTTPTFNHEQSVRLALQKGCAVFCEKPLAINTEQAKHICGIVSQRGIPVQIGFCNRFAPSFLKCYELLRQNVIGKVSHVHAEMFIGDVFEEHTGWRYKKELSGGGALMDFGIHMVDLLIHYFGKVKRVNAHSKQLYSKYVEDELSAQIVFESDIVCNFETSWSKEEYRKSYSKMTITGTEGTIVATDQTLDIYLPSGDKTEEYTYPDLYGGDYMDIGGMLYSHQMSEFLQRLGKRLSSSVGCTPDQALYVQKVIEALYESAEKHKEVEVGKKDVD